MYLLRLMTKTCAREKESEFDKLLLQDKTRLGLCKPIPCMFYDGLVKVGEGHIVDVEITTLSREYFILHNCDLELLNDWVNCFDDEVKYVNDIGMMSTFDPEKALNGNDWDRNVIIFQTKLRLPRADHTAFADWIHANYSQYGKQVPTEPDPEIQIKRMAAFERLVPAEYEKLTDEDKEELRRALYHLPRLNLTNLPGDAKPEEGDEKHDD